MHAPDGFLAPAVAAATAAVSGGAIGVSLRQTRAVLGEKQVPLAGAAAAFIFAAQMINFPVGAGTSGHLLGATLAAILLGPSLGAVVVAVVVIVQAIAFGDGGITALGYNVLNMAVIPAYGGAMVFSGLRRLLPATSGGVVAATGLASGISVVFGAAALSVEWLFGATAPIPFDTVFGAMVSVHSLIGIGEGTVSALVVGSVLAARPDLVHGASDLDIAKLNQVRIPRRVFVFAAVVIALAMATAISQFAAETPDGLERVSSDLGLADGGVEGSGWAGRFFADYATAGIDNEMLSLAVAGAVGVGITMLVSAGLIRSSLRR